MDWAKKVNGVIEVDALKAYPAFLDELKVEEIDQYWLEVIFQCIKMDCQVAFGWGPIHIIDKGRKYAQKKFPVGKGPYAATKGKEAREHYLILRGYMPRG